MKEIVLENSRDGIRETADEINISTHFSLCFEYEEHRHMVRANFQTDCD